MKKLLLYLSMVLTASTLCAQLVSLEVETVVVHPSTDYSDGVNLDGYTTYRVWAVMQNENDFLSAVYGLENQITTINTTGDFWHSSFGGVSAEYINQEFLTLVPSLEFDSYVTIGKVFQQDPGQPIFLAGSDWVTTFDPGAGAPGSSFQLAGMIGGSWFTVNLGPVDSVNGYAGADLKVLIGQFTTNGTLTGNVNIQVFPLGVGDNAVNSVATFGAVFGCTDPAADNYDPTAEVDDGSCLYPCMLDFGTITAVDPSCQGLSDGSITIDMVGAQIATTYSIDGATPIGVGSFSGLTPGVYSIEVIDAVCSATTTVELFDSGLGMDVAVTQPLMCFGDANGMISGTYSGVNGTVQFSLDPEFMTTQSTPDFGNLGTGSYTIYASDDACSIQSDVFTLVEPQELIGNVANMAPATCSDTEDGVLVMSSSGGTGQITYSLDGVNYDANNIIYGFGGSYTVYLMDDNGCVTPIENTIIGAPDELMLGADVTGISCNGLCDASILTTISGGNGQYSFWLDGGDADPFGDYLDLCSGDYLVYCSDFEGCMDSVVFTVTEPSEVGVMLDAFDVSCIGDGDGLIVATSSGGTPDFEFSIDGVNFQMDSNFGNLDPGTYDITVVDANGCSSTSTISIAEPTALLVTVDGVVLDDGTSSGSIDVTVTGGTGAYTYSWTGPNGFTSDLEDLTGLEAGDYSLTVTDENGCMISESNVTVVTGIGELENDISFNVAPNPSNGQFRLNISGLNGQKVSYVIVDATGRTVLSQSLNVNSGDYTDYVDMTNTSNGVYFMTLIVGQSQKTVKLLKQY